MSDRPRFFDDLAGVAGGAISALAGLREEAEALVRARIDEAIRRLDLVKREELEALAELAANARAGQEAAEARLTEAMERLAALEVRVAALETRKHGRLRLAARHAGSVGCDSWLTWSRNSRISVTSEPSGLPAPAFLMTGDQACP